MFVVLKEDLVVNSCETHDEAIDLAKKHAVNTGLKIFVAEAKECVIVQPVVISLDVKKPEISFPQQKEILKDSLSLPELEEINEDVKINEDIIFEWHSKNMDINITLDEYREDFQARIRIISRLINNHCGYSNSSDTHIVSMNAIKEAFDQVFEYISKLNI